jgi:broad specificity phosphatase PhoE
MALCPLARGGDVIVVSHRLTLKTVILKVVGASLQDFWSIRLDTASISILETTDFGAGERLTLSRLNDVSHLARLGIPDRIDF